MSNRRIELHNILLSIFKSDAVYYQPPENLKMKFPCIIYNKSNIDSTYADNVKYINKSCYSITIIDKKPDNNVINKILELPLSSYDRHYISNNFNHDVITIYY